MTALLTLWRHARLATLAGPARYGFVEHGAVLVEGDRIAWAGAEADLPVDIARRATTEHDLGGALVTPGLIDCHTHLVYAGQRAREFELRLEGASYEEIARSGGGIRSTVAATRAASDDGLFAAAVPRARALMAEGVTTVEIKSGYGLSLHDERRCLATARRLGAALDLSVRATCLAAHTLPPEYEGRADAYVDAVCSWLPMLQAEGLVDAVDAFCERIAFSTAQTERVFAAAKALGIPVKLHAEQLSDSGGAQLAARYGALSCDHLEWLSPEGAQAMAAAGSIAVLLPGAFYFLRETRLPPVALLREQRVPMAISTDCNPGSSPCTSLLLMLNMACTLFRLTPEEALAGVTRHAAAALGLRDRGVLADGNRADFVLWGVQRPAELSYALGANPRLQTVFKGRLV